MGAVNCIKHGLNVGSLTSKKIRDAMIGKAEVSVSEIVPIILVIDKEMEVENLKPTLLDSAYINKFGLKKDEKTVFLENHVELLSEITIVCWFCFKDFLDNIGYEEENK